MPVSRDTILQSIADHHLMDSDELDNIELEYLYPVIESDLIAVFKREFEAIGGKLIHVSNLEELRLKLSGYIADPDARCYVCDDVALSFPEFKKADRIEDNTYIVTSCEFLVARTGSIVVSSHNSGGRVVNILPEKHLVVAGVSQLVATLSDAYREIAGKYNELPSLISTITGPSRTADIEKTLVLGAHGPKEIVLFLITNK